MQTQPVIDDRIASRIPRPPDPPGWAGPREGLPDGIDPAASSILLTLSGTPLHLPNTVFRKFKRIHRQMLLPSPLCKLPTFIKLE